MASRRKAIPADQFIEIFMNYYSEENVDDIDFEASLTDEGDGWESADDDTPSTSTGRGSERSRVATGTKGSCGRGRKDVNNTHVNATNPATV